MRYENRLTAQSLQALHKLTFFAQTLTVYNTSPYAVLIRRGSSLPDALSYDYIVPAGTYKTLPVSGYEFGLKIDVSGEPGQFLPVLYTFAADEPVPTFSLAHYRESQEFESLSGEPLYLIDARGATGLYIELSWSTGFLFSSSTQWSCALCYIYAGSTRDFSLTTENLITVQPLVDSHVNARISLPVTNPFYKILIVRNTSTDFPIRVRYQLTDTFAGASIQRAAISHAISLSSASWPYNTWTTWLSDMLVGTLDALILAFNTNQPLYRYEFSLSMSAEPDAALSRVVRSFVIASEYTADDLPVAETGNYLVAYHPSPRYYFYHIPLDLAVNGFVRLSAKRTLTDSFMSGYAKVLASLELQR